MKTYECNFSTPAEREDAVDPIMAILANLNGNFNVYPSYSFDGCPILELKALGLLLKHIQKIDLKNPNRKPIKLDGTCEAGQPCGSFAIEEKHEGIPWLIFKQNCSTAQE